MLAAAPDDPAIYESLRLATDYSRINCELVRVELEKHRVSRHGGYQ